jgi:phage terminase large subunit-like protein
MSNDVDTDRWDWYGISCRCGLPAGQCSKHPRARHEQRPPAGPWKTWAFLGGRGLGTTRAGAEWLVSRAKRSEHEVLAIMGPTLAFVRETMIEGASGILSISPPWFTPKWQSSKRRLTWPNGATAYIYTGGEPDRLRGMNHTGAWIDGIDAFKKYEAVDNFMYGLRLGYDPQVCVTGSPAGPVIPYLAKFPGGIVRTGPPPIHNIALDLSPRSQTA